jgi:hypothetical protein
VGARGRAATCSIVHVDAEPIPPGVFFADMNSKSSEPNSNAQKDPADWKTGDEPMTGAQKSYLETLSAEAKEPLEPDLTKADASRRIDELQKKTGRGLEGKQGPR